MKWIFFFFCVVSMCIMLFTAPQNVLSAMLSGAKKAALMCVTLLSIYSVWLGIYKIAEKTGAGEKFAKLLSPITSKIFGVKDKKINRLLSLNISANMLGLNGIATPLGIEACSLLDKNGNHGAKAMLLVISSTSVQLLPTSVMSLMSEYGSSDPSAIFLPTLLSTIISTVSGIILCRIFCYKKQTS